MKSGGLWRYPLPGCRSTKLCLQSSSKLSPPPSSDASILSQSSSSTSNSKSSSPSLSIISAHNTGEADFNYHDTIEISSRDNLYIKDVCTMLSNYQYLALSHGYEVEHVHEHGHEEKTADEPIYAYQCNNTKLRPMNVDYFHKCARNQKTKRPVPMDCHHQAEFISEQQNQRPGRVCYTKI